MAENCRLVPGGKRSLFCQEVAAPNFTACGAGHFLPRHSHFDHLSSLDWVWIATCAGHFLAGFEAAHTLTMVLQDLGRRINAAVSDLTRAPNLDEKVATPEPQLLPPPQLPCSPADFLLSR